MNSTPVVTVYIPTKNRLMLLKRAVDSVLTQDYKNLELIIIDDGSTDDTLEYLIEKSQADSRVIYFSNTQSLGACASRNKAIFSARGYFITGLDDDDYFLPGRISGFVKSWPENNLVQGLYSNAKLIKKNGKVTSVNRPKICTQKKLLIKNYIGSQIFTRTKILRENGGFDINFSAWQDLDLWYRVLGGDNFVMQKVNGATYVIDISHDHERISTKSIVNIKKSLEVFSEVHQLKLEEFKIIYNQIFPYCPQKLKAYHVFETLFKYGSISSAIEIAKTYVLFNVKKIIFERRSTDV